MVLVFAGGAQIYLTLLAGLLIQDKKGMCLNLIVSSGNPCFQLERWTRRLEFSCLHLTPMINSLYILFFSLDIAPGSTRVAVIASAGQVPVALHLNNTSMSQAVVHAAIDSLVLSSPPQLREMAYPLQAATAMLNEDGRSSLPKFILMAVFGESENPIRSKYRAAFAAQNSVDVDIFTWGFGVNYGSTGPALAELEFVAKDGDSSFTQPDFTTDISSSAVSAAVCDCKFKIYCWMKIKTELLKEQLV